MNYIEITRAEARDRYDKGEKIYAMPCKLTPYGYWGSPLTLDKAKFDELGARFDEVIRAYMVLTSFCYRCGAKMDIDYDENE